MKRLINVNREDKYKMTEEGKMSLCEKKYTLKFYSDKKVTEKAEESKKEKSLFTKHEYDALNEESTKKFLERLDLCIEDIERKISDLKSIRNLKEKYINTQKERKFSTYIKREINEIVIINEEIKLLQEEIENIRELEEDLNKDIKPYNVKIVLHKTEYYIISKIECIAKKASDRIAEDITEELANKRIKIRKLNINSKIVNKIYDARRQKKLDEGFKLCKEISEKTEQKESNENTIEMASNINKNFFEEACKKIDEAYDSTIDFDKITENKQKKEILREIKIALIKLSCTKKIKSISENIKNKEIKFAKNL